MEQRNGKEGKGIGSFSKGQEAVLNRVVRRGHIEKVP